MTSMGIAETGYNRLLSRHALGFCAAAVAALAAAEALNALSLPGQFIALIVFTIATGIPHGAMDVVTAERLLLPRFGSRWLVAFTGGYAALALPIVIGWIAFPAASLAVFLCLAAYHFGSSDTEKAGLPLAARIIEGLGRGLTPIAMPAAFHPQQVNELFAMLSSPAAADDLTGLFAGAAPVGLGCLALSIVLRLVDSFSARRLSPLSSVAELALLPALFAALTPLMAFTAYWCFLHSLRVTLLMSSPHGSFRSDVALRLYLKSAPITLATLVLGVIGWLALSPHVSSIAAVNNVLFVGLAAVNFPHMLFIAATERLR